MMSRFYIRKTESIPPIILEKRNDRGLFALTKTAGAFALLFFLLIFASNFSMIREHGSMLLTCFLAIGFTGCILLLTLSGIQARLILFAALIIGFLARLILILVAKTEPVLDFLCFYDGAQSILTHDLSVFDTGYFAMYPNLIPICWYYALLFSIHNSLLFAECFNLLFMTGCILLLYLIGIRLTDKKSAALSALVYAMYPSVIQTASQLTNQHLSLFFFLLGIYLLCKGSILSCLFAGIALSAGNLFRSEGAVLYAALAVFFVLCLLFGNQERPGAKGVLLRAFSLLAAVLVSASLLAGLFTRLSEHPIRAEKSYVWKLIVGFDDAESGTYSNTHRAEYDAGRDGMEIVKEEICEQKNWPDFLFRKIKMQWGSYEDPTYSFSAADGNKKLDIGPLHTDINGLIRRGLILDKAMYLMILLLSAGGTSILFAKQKISTLSLLFLLILDAYFCVYLLIEVGARYRYFILPFLLILAGPLFDTIRENVNKIQHTHPASLTEESDMLQ